MHPLIVDVSNVIHLHTSIDGTGVHARVRRVLCTGLQAHCFMCASGWYITFGLRRGFSLYHRCEYRRPTVRGWFVVLTVS